MRRLNRTVALLLALLLAVAGAGPAVGAPLEDHQAENACSFPLTRTDATGTAVTVEDDPDRVVALHASAAQTMWEIGGSGEVVGMPVNRYTSYLEGYQRPRDVVAADEFTVVVEGVVNASPDLVLAPNVTPVETVSKLRSAGLTVYHFEAARTIEDVYAKTLLTGQLTGNCDGAAERTARMRVRIDRVREAVADEPRPTVIYPLGGGVVAGNGTFLHELITTAGGRNLAADAGIDGYRPISAEEIEAADPDWLILNEDLPRSAVQMDAYNRTTAVERDQIVRINPNYANQPAPRIAVVVEQLARALHPGVLAEANATAAPGTATTAPSTAPATSSGGQPGFGLAVALAALAVALLTARRGRRP